MIQCRHFPNCREIPREIRQQLVALKKSGCTVTHSGSRRKQYWSDSARDMGFVDTDGGIRFVGDDEVTAADSSVATTDVGMTLVASTNDNRDEPWTCECGEQLAATRKRCGVCLKWKGANEERS